jgi:hypothetical protein
MYVNNMIIIGDDEGGIAQLNARLEKKFEVKDLGQLRYFFGIEITHVSRRDCSISEKVCAILAHKDIHVRLLAYNFSN